MCVCVCVYISSNHYEQYLKANSSKYRIFLNNFKVINITISNIIKLKLAISVWFIVFQC